MSLLRRLVLPGLPIALGLVLAAELMAAPGGGGPLPPPALPMAKAATSVSARLADHWAETVLARPLFSADRRPETLGRDHATGLARLAGIIISGDSRSAIFAADGHKPEILSEGGEIGGYRLLHISSDSVELAGAAGMLTLHPNVPAAAPVAAAALVQPAPARKLMFGYDNE